MCASKVAEGKERGWIIPIGGAEEKDNAPAILRRFVQLAVIAGHFPGHTVEELLPVECLPPRFGYVNPRDEVEADIAAIGAGLKSREQVIAENGFDIEQIDAQLAADPRQPSEAPRP